MGELQEALKELRGAIGGMTFCGDCGKAMTTEEIKYLEHNCNDCEMKAHQALTDEFKEYACATTGMNDKARQKLASYMAHGYELAAHPGLTLLVRDGKHIAIGKNGDLWVLQKAI